MNVTKTQKTQIYNQKIDKYCKICLNDWKNAHGIYAIKDINDDKIVYIGQTRQTFQKRYYFHIKNKDGPFYGGENYELLPIFPLYGEDDVDLDELETYYIWKYNTIHDGFNKVASNANKRAFREHYDELLMRSDGKLLRLGDNNVISPNVSMIWCFEYDGFVLRDADFSSLMDRVLGYQYSFAQFVDGVSMSFEYEYRKSDDVIWLRSSSLSGLFEKMSEYGGPLCVREVLF